MFLLAKGYNNEQIWKEVNKFKNKGGQKKVVNIDRKILETQL
jgi:hypothetical protein